MAGKKRKKEAVEPSGSGVNLFDEILLDTGSSLDKSDVTLSEVLQERKRHDKIVEEVRGLETEVSMLRQEFELLIETKMQGHLVEIRDLMYGMLMDQEEKIKKKVESKLRRARAGIWRLTWD